jgi:hypothetical protein
MTPSGFHRWLFRASAVLLAGLLGSGAVRADEGPYMRVRFEAGPHDLARIGAAGIPVEEAVRLPGGGRVLMLTPAEISRMEGLGLALTVLDADVSRTYADRARRDQAPSVQSRTSRAANFHLGSMGGYLTLAEVESELDSMRRAYPSLITFREAIGVTAENRTIWAVRISRNPETDEAEPRVLFTALHHAREPGGMMALLYTMWHLLEQYGVNDDVTQILDHRELTFVPVVNPDGYAYNQSGFPGGGGMWRKNRRVNGDGSYGVDLNRNYGYKWGADNIGSSPTTSSETYRGPSAFSEPEVVALRDLCAARGYTLAVNYHSYANAIIYPWGWSDAVTPDSLAYRRIAGMMTLHSYYNSGTSVETIGYATNGDADDWMYGERVAKPKIFAMTVEVGGSDDGFWPAPSRILPIADENLESNLIAARLAGESYGLEMISQEQKHDNDTIAVSLRLVNAGVQTASSGVTVQFSAANGTVETPSNLFVSAPTNTPLSVRLRGASGIADGSRVWLLTQVSSSAGRVRDSIGIRAGVPALVFADGADSIRAYWASASIPLSGTNALWDTTGRMSFTGWLCYTDSPSGEYGRNVSSTFTLQDAIPLNGIGAELRFRARWDIEHEYDCALVEATTDGGGTWAPLSGRFTRPGSGVARGKQTAGVPCLDRLQRTWVEEVMGLDHLAGSTIQLRFRMESDAYLERDGIYIDDISVLVYKAQATAVAAVDQPVALRMMQNYPNPFNGQTRIRFELLSDGDPASPLPVSLVVFDPLGRERAVLLRASLPAGVHEIPFDAVRFPSGMYFYQLRCGGMTMTRPMVLLR